MSDDMLNAFRQQLMAALPHRLLCVDVGARWGADNALLSLKQVSTLLCFEPDAAECERLQVQHDIQDVRYVPMALSSDGRELRMHVTREPACSSVYPPEPVLYRDYPCLKIIEPVRVETCRSITLDTYLADLAFDGPDWIKLDTQGSELDILRGAQRSLASVCMIDVEVEFNPIYAGQPLFGDVDQYLRANGFALWRLPLLAHYAPAAVKAASTTVHLSAAPAEPVHATLLGNGQLFWAQAHYVRRDHLATSQTVLSQRDAVRAALIASSYGYWDLALTVLQKCPDTAELAQNLSALL